MSLKASSVGDQDHSFKTWMEVKNTLIFIGYHPKECPKLASYFLWVFSQTIGIEDWDY